MNLTEKLVTLRKQKGLTQIELAEKLNVSRQAISRWEVGSSVPTADNLKMLSELYGVTIDYLLNYDADPVNKILEGQKVVHDVGNQKASSRSHIILGVCAVIVSIVLAGSIFARQEKEQSIPIEDMTVVEENELSTVVLPIE